MDRSPITVLTGATSGIGYETAKMLFVKGHHLVLGNRNPEKAEKLARELRELNPEGTLESLDLDLASFVSIKAFSERLHELHGQIDNLINNAGVLVRRKATTAEGFELTMGVNHLGTMYLTESLKDLLKEKSHVVMVSSIGCYWGTIKVRDDSFTRCRNPFQNYFDSKLANLAYVKELADELKPMQIQVRAADPGIVYSHIFKWRTRFGKFLERIQRRIMKSPIQGANVVISLVEGHREMKDDQLMFTLRKSRKLPRKIRDSRKRKAYVSHARKAIDSAINDDL